MIASRNIEKCKDVVIEIQKRYPSAEGELEASMLDTSDLDSVRSFANEYMRSHSKLHYLVNNAGINYITGGISELLLKNDEHTSRQGYDKAFTTNYLGHFLLSELLIELIDKTAKELNKDHENINFNGRIVNIASLYHFQSDGSMLKTTYDSYGRVLSIPEAARSDIKTTSHKLKQYGNNKLAQVLHAKALQFRFNQNGLRIKAVAVCPGWSKSNIFPDNALGAWIYKNSFPIESSILSAVMSLFDENLKGGEFIQNSRVFIFTKLWLGIILGKFLQFTSIFYARDIAFDALGLLILKLQKYSYGYNISESSVESNDKELMRSLYDWSLEEMKSKGYLTSRRD